MAEKTCRQRGYCLRWHIVARVSIGKGAETEDGIGNDTIGTFEVVGHASLDEFHGRSRTIDVMHLGIPADRIQLEEGGRVAVSAGEESRGGQPASCAKLLERMLHEPHFR